MKYKIMIIEDDKSIAELLEAHLDKFGFDAYICTNFESVVDEFNSLKPHLVLLDITLPAFDGFYWCSKLRKVSSCPIIFISARNADIDQVFAISNGGDDYITKPFSANVVTAKINAQLRRVYGEYSNQVSEILRYGDCEFSKNKFILSGEKGSVELSKTEAIILDVLFEKSPGVVTREELLNEIWDTESFVEDNTLNVNIFRTRKKLEQIGSKMIIKSIRGVGYRVGASNEV